MCGVLVRVLAAEIRSPWFVNLMAVVMVSDGERCIFRHRSILHASVKHMYVDNILICVQN